MGFHPLPFVSPDDPPMAPRSCLCNNDTKYAAAKTRVREVSHADPVVGGFNPKHLNFLIDVGWVYLSDTRRRSLDSRFFHRGVKFVADPVLIVHPCADLPSVFLEYEYPPDQTDDHGSLEKLPYQDVTATPW